MVEVGNVSTNGYKLLKLAATAHAVYSCENRRTLLCIRGVTVEISDSDLERISASRGIISETSSPTEVSTTIHDLLVDSLLPVSEYDDAEISRRAPIFLSAFDATAAWRTITPSSKIREQTESAEGVSVSPATVYLRQRFPNLRFEWELELTGRELKTLCNSAAPFTIRTAWSAYLCAGYGAVNASTLGCDIWRLIWAYCQVDYCP
ncbi:hypothetical protein BS47DRAFT_669125 [Hydnum rufescens UP504]|uniref:Uncharacterized protein n=1 Tax=Hydnum rufescens UP504 TaxID=1448309 RepID=A0A9P6B2M4_9AGAM|nr:hypothetical protein BS47DRAFT_669125 [Hydnum rufescens UP504]